MSQKVSKKSKSEQRLDSIRKSIRKKTKGKEQHHEIALNKKGKENKIEKVVGKIGSKSSWTESLQSLNSAELEEEFLPDVVKQKKEQKRLHSEPTFNSTSPEKKSRKRAHSTPATTSSDVSAKKPPVPPTNKKSKSKTPSNSSLVLNDLPEEQDSSDGTEESKPATNADNLFAWVISPIKADQFLRFVLLFLTQFTRNIVRKHYLKVQQYKNRELTKQNLCFENMLTFLSFNEILVMYGKRNLYLSKGSNLLTIKFGLAPKSWILF